MIFFSSHSPLICKLSLDGWKAMGLIYMCVKLYICVIYIYILNLFSLYMCFKLILYYLSLYFTSFIWFYLLVFLLLFKISHRLLYFIHFYYFLISLRMPHHDYWIYHVLKFIWEYLIQKLLKDVSCFLYYFYLIQFDYFLCLHFGHSVLCSCPATVWFPVTQQ